MRRGEDELWKDACFSSGPYELQCLFECASADFTCNSGEQWENWGDMGQEGIMKGRCCILWVGCQAPGREGRDPWGRQCCVWALGARAAPQSSAALQGDRHNVQQGQGDLWGHGLGVNMGQMQLHFSILLCFQKRSSSIFCYKRKLLVPFFPEGSGLCLTNYSL